MESIKTSLDLVNSRQVLSRMQCRAGSQPPLDADEAPRKASHNITVVQ